MLPYHVIETGGGIDTVDPLILIGPACVVKLDVPAGSYGITVDDVKAWEEENGEIQSGEAVLFHTGHDALWETDPDEYITNYPYLLPETAQYMVDKGVRYIAMESISPDTTTTESHQILLGNGVGVVENVCNLGGHRGRPLLYHRHLPQLPGCHRRLDPDLGTLSVKLCSTNAEGPPHLGRPFSLRKKESLEDFSLSRHPDPFPPRPGRKAPRLALLAAPCGARAAGLGFPFEADFRPLELPRPIPKHLL